jgi:hypothetical protein
VANYSRQFHILSLHEPRSPNLNSNVLNLACEWLMLCSPWNLDVDNRFFSASKQCSNLGKAKGSKKPQKGKGRVGGLVKLKGRRGACRGRGLLQCRRGIG